MMLEEQEGTFYRELEAKRIIALLNNLYLDTRTNGTDYRDNWKDYMQYLKDLKNPCPKSTYMAIFIDQIENQDYNYTVENLKAIPDYSIAQYFQYVNAKA